MTTVANPSAADLAAREQQRTALYKATVALIRAYANVADELEPAGYSGAEVGRIKSLAGSARDVDVLTLGK
jgi:type I restriction enzyme R subunit